ncbi:SLC26A/SulP transporter [Tanacetum coccineum]
MNVVLMASFRDGVFYPSNYFGHEAFVLLALIIYFLFAAKVGDIPQGLPPFSFPKDFSNVKSLIPTSFLITGVAILESVGIAKALAAKNGYELDSNQECALAAIVISAVIGLVDYDEAIFLWRVDKKDFFLWTVTFATTLFLGIEIGVLVGESANPHIAVLGRLPGTTVYRNIQQYPEAYTYNGIVIVRIDAPIYFANTSYIKDRLREYEIVVDQSSKRGPEVERIYFVILEMAPVTYVDSSAVQALKELYQEYNSRDIQIVKQYSSLGLYVLSDEMG